MSKIQNAFQNGKAFIGFLTAGDPNLQKTEEYILAMEEAGADLIEIGIPFSDPIAEGPVIQDANIRSLSVGTTTDKVFDMVVSVRKKTQIPLVFLTYLNPVFKYGIIIPDMPYEEKGELLSIAKANDVDVISMIAPTSEDRIRRIAGEATGFIYVVSSMGVTGMRSEIKTDLEGILETIREASTTPAAIGFGINTPEQAAKYGAMADGVIVGSAIVKLIEKYGENAKEPLMQYVKSMKNAVISQ